VGVSLVGSREKNNRSGREQQEGERGGGDGMVCTWELERMGVIIVDELREDSKAVIVLEEHDLRLGLVPVLGVLGER